MLFSKVIIFSIHAYSALCCGINMKTQYNHDVTYKYGCLEAVESVYDLSICILQRNSIEKILSCTGEENEVLYWTVKTGSKADAWDMLPPEQYSDKLRKASNDDEGRVYVTPRGVLVVAASTNHCADCELDAIFKKCPYNPKSREFMDCLYCEGVKDDQMECLNECIWKSPSRKYSKFEDESQKAIKVSRTDVICKARSKSKPNTNSRRMADEKSVRPTSTASCDSEYYIYKSNTRSYICETKTSQSSLRYFALPTSVSSWSSISSDSVPAAASTSTNNFAEQASATASGGSNDEAQTTTVSPATPSASPSDAGQKNGGSSREGYFVGSVLVTLIFCLAIML